MKYYVYEATFTYKDGKKFNMRYRTIADSEPVARMNATHYFKKYRCKSIPFKAELTKISLIKIYKA